MVGATSQAWGYQSGGGGKVLEWDPSGGHTMGRTRCVPLDFTLEGSFYGMSTPFSPKRDFNKKRHLLYVFFEIPYGNVPTSARQKGSVTNVCNKSE